MVDRQGPVDYAMVLHVIDNRPFPLFRYDDDKLDDVIEYGRSRVSDGFLQCQDSIFLRYFA